MQEVFSTFHSEGEPNGLKKEFQARFNASQETLEAYSESSLNPYSTRVRSLEEDIQQIKKRAHPEEVRERLPNKIYQLERYRKIELVYPKLIPYLQPGIPLAIIYADAERYSRFRQFSKLLDDMMSRFPQGHDPKKDPRIDALLDIYDIVTSQRPRLAAWEVDLPTYFYQYQVLRYEVGLEAFRDYLLEFFEKFIDPSYEIRQDILHQRLFQKGIGGSLLDEIRRLKGALSYDALKQYTESRIDELYDVIFGRLR